MQCCFHPDAASLFSGTGKARWVVAENSISISPIRIISPCDYLMGTRLRQPGTLSQYNRRSGAVQPGMRLHGCLKSIQRMIVMGVRQ